MSGSPGSRTAIDVTSEPRDLRRQRPCEVSDTGRLAPWASQRLDDAPGMPALAATRLAFDCSVDRGPADAEEFGDLEGAVLAAVHQRDQVGLLLSVELGLLAAQPALGFGDLHA